jgi:hypothetical protein
MGLWVPRAQTDDGERVLTTFAANHSAGARAVGGRVTVTSDALHFTPNRLDRLTGGKPLRLDRWSVHRFTVGQRTTADGPFSGGRRKRLEVHGADGRLAFVVNGVERRIAELRAFWAMPDA